jgi:CheY-like chemotaxis protein
MTSAAHILLVEDDSAIRESVAECLQSEGHAVHAARNGAEALAWLREGNRPTLVVLDLVMPVMDGARFLQALRSEPALRDLPAVLMTAAMASPANPLPLATAYLEKPFELAALLEVVERLSR